MGSVFSAFLSPAVGVLISPFPIVGLILILLSDNARKNSIFYALGWVLGNAAVFSIAMLCMRTGAASQGGSSALGKIIALILGALLILFSVKEFLGRAKAGEEAKTPKWFDKMSKISPLGAAGFGAFLSALNPKNLLLSISAGTAVGALNVSASYELAAAIAYTLIASGSIIVPTVAFFIAGRRLDKALGAMRVWLVQNNALIMSLLLLLIGLNMVSKAF